MAVSLELSFFLQICIISCLGGGSASSEKENILSMFWKLNVKWNNMHRN